MYGVPMVPMGPMYKNGICVTGGICGIVGLVLFWMPWFGFILGVLGAIFGGVGLNQVKSGVANNRAMAITGLVCGILAATAWLILIVAVASFVSSWSWY